MRFTFSSHESLTGANDVPQKHDILTNPFEGCVNVWFGRGVNPQLGSFSRRSEPCYGLINISDRVWIVAVMNCKERVGY